MVQKPIDIPAQAALGGIVIVPPVGVRHGPTVTDPARAIPGDAR